jgi:hypothetical protein
VLLARVVDIDVNHELGRRSWRHWERRLQPQLSAVSVAPSMHTATPGKKGTLTFPGLLAGVTPAAVTMPIPKPIGTAPTKPGHCPMSCVFLCPRRSRQHSLAAGPQRSRHEKPHTRTHAHTASTSFWPRSDRRAGKAAGTCGRSSLCRPPGRSRAESCTRGGV